MLGLVLLLAACTPAEPRQAPPTEPVQSRPPVVFPETWRFSSNDTPVSAEHAVVVSTDSVASAIGALVMQEGGNAVDAAVAVSLALAVVNPQAGNIGGGGFMVVRMADGTAAALDYREKAPLEATRDMFLDDRGNLTDKSVVGHLAAGVPGSVMGIWEAHQRFGTLSWANLVEPAAELADGFEVHERFRDNIVGSERGIRLFETTAATFLPGGRIADLGETFSQPELAATLRRIRDRGADGFYRGETADLIVAEMARGDGLISHRDLEAYTAAWRDPIEFTYRGFHGPVDAAFLLRGRHDGRNGQHLGALRAWGDSVALDPDDSSPGGVLAAVVRGPERISGGPGFHRCPSRALDGEGIRRRTSR